MGRGYLSAKSIGKTSVLLGSCSFALGDIYLKIAGTLSKVSSLCLSKSYVGTLATCLGTHI